MVENDSDDILAGADKEDVAFCVVGDPFGYTYNTLTSTSIRRIDILITKQSNNAQRPRTPRACPKNPRPVHPQRQHPQRNRQYRAAAVQFRADSINGVFPG